MSIFYMVYADKHFNKHLGYSACMLGKRKYASPNDIACDSHERRKR